LKAGRKWSRRYRLAAATVVMLFSLVKIDLVPVVRVGGFTHLR
jgi:hypothetical protein